MNYAIALVLCFFLFFLPKSYSQPTVQLPAIESFSFGNLHAATTNAGITTYSCCYEVKDKSVDGKIYSCRFFDKNLQEIHTWAFTCNDKQELLATAYNGSDFMTIILDTKKRILYHRVYNLATKKELQYEDKLDANSQFYLEKHLPPDVSLPGVAKMLYTFGSADFVSLIPTKHDNVFTYDVNIFLKSNGYQKVAFTPETDVKMQQASFVGNTENLLLFYVFSKKDVTNNKYESNLLGIETATGKKKFEVSTKEGDFPYLPLKVAYRQGQKDFTVLGNYFKENARVKIAKFKGLCLLRMNEAGQIETKNTLDWKENFGKPAKEESVQEEAEDTTSQEIKNFQVQAFTQASDGSLYIAGEGYRYHTEAGVMATKIILAGAGGMLGGLAASGIPDNPFMVTDMVLIHAGDNLKIDSIARYGKKEHHATEFDTDFCTNLPAQNQFIVAYRDYNLGKVKEEFSEKLLLYGNSGRPTLLQSSISTKAINYQILPASENEVLLVEYFIKKQQAILSIKQLDKQ